MLITSRIKLILLFIPIILATLWSLTNNNNDTHNDVKLYYNKRNALLVEVQPVSVVHTITLVKLPEVIVQQDTKPKTLKEQVKCMAHNIYHEAGGEPYMGQVAVARVVMNRVNHGFADNPCKVIYQTTKRVDPETERAITHCQFSWVCQGKISPNTNSDRYKVAEEIAELVITENKWHDEIPHDILFFHNQTVKPRWKYQKSFNIGNHTFYAKNSPTEKK